MPGFSNRLLKVRNDKSQTEFAAFLGIEQTHISRYENDKAKPGYEFLYLLAEKLNVNIHWLLTGEGEMYITNQPTSERAIHSKEQREAELADRVREAEKENEYLRSVIKTVIETASAIKTKRKKKSYTPLNNNGIINYSLN